MNQNANFGASLSSDTGTDTYVSNVDGSFTGVVLNPPTLYIRGFGLTPNVGSTRYTYNWVGANAVATTNQQQLAGYSVASQTVSNVWTCTITDTLTGKVVTPLPSYNQTYTAPAALITFVRQTSGSGAFMQERYVCTATAYNATATSYNWTYVASNSLATFATSTTASSVTTTYLLQQDASGASDTVRCAIGYSSGTLTVTSQFTWA